MFFVPLIFIALLAKSYVIADVPGRADDVIAPAAFAPPANGRCTQNTNPSKSYGGLQFRLPFMDMEIENERSLHIMREPITQQLFVLHGADLFQVFIGPNEMRLSLIGRLAGSVNEVEPLGAEVISWRNKLLFAVALDEYLEIYQISIAMIVERAALTKLPLSDGAVDVPPLFEPIQQLTLLGRYQRLFLTEPLDGKVMLIVAVNFTKLYGKFRTYEWSNTYFDLIEEFSVPPIFSPHVFGTFPKYVVSGKDLRRQSKTILTIYEVQPPTLHLRRVQTLTVNARNVHCFTYEGSNYVIACPSKPASQLKCNTFRMDQGQFSLYKRRAGEELAFDRFVAGRNFLVGILRNELKVYTTGRMDCYASLTTNATDVPNILTHANEHHETYVLLTFRHPFSTLIRIIAIERNSGELLGQTAGNATIDIEDLGAAGRHEHIFEDTIGRLRSLLLKRKTAMDVFRSVSNLVAPKMLSLELEQSVRVHDGKIGVVRVDGRHLASPIQLLKRISDMSDMFGRVRRGRRALEDTRKSDLLEMPRRLRVQHLQVDNLIYDGTVMDGFRMENQTHSPPMLTINTKLRTRTLDTEELVTPADNSKRERQVDAPENSTATTIKARRLDVERINGVPWAEFYESLFLKNRDTKIQGRLVLQANTSVTNLQTPSLNGLEVEQLFDLRRPQVVNSNIKISRFFVSDLHAETVNGLNFAKDIVFSGKDTFIETPVVMYDMSIAGDLLLANNTKFEHATAVEGSELLQHYTGKVVINGSLTVNNLIRDNGNESNILVAGTRFSPEELRRNYLLQSEDQTFEEPVMFGNAKVTTPQFATTYINGHPRNEHLFTTKQLAAEKPVFLVFLSARVEGDLINRDNDSKVLELHRNAVRHGDLANITGTKTFRSTLTVDNVMALELNHSPVEDLVLKSQLEKGLRFGGAKTFASIVVTDKAIIQKSLNATYLNNLPLSELLNYDYHFDSLRLPHRLDATNIVIHQINGISIDHVFTQFNVKNEQVMLHKELIVEGNVTFGGALNLDMLNDLEWNTYRESLVRSNENAYIRGHKGFLRGMTVVKDLDSPIVNHVNVSQVFSNILSKSQPQRISGVYTFANLRASNLEASVVNEVPTAAFIDLRSEELVIAGDIVVPKVTVAGNTTGNFVNQFQFDAVPQRLEALKARPWRNVVVHGDAHWVTAASDNMQQSQLEYLHSHAVRCRGNQTISGNVKLRRPLISRMSTRTEFPQDIDFDAIARDGLFKNANAVQTIAAPKTFVKRLHALRVEFRTSLNTRLLNNIDVWRLNASLYRLSSGDPVMGTLHFNVPPTIRRLTVEGLVNGAEPAHIYHGLNKTLPPVKLRTLLIDDVLSVGSINGMSLNYLLENRVTKNGPALEVFGHLTFEELVLEQEVLLQSINGIPVDNLVFKRSDHLQAITGSKVIQGNLILAGPTHVMHLNDRDLIDAYQQTIFTDRSHHFDTLALDRATFERGLVFTNEFVSSARAGPELAERNRKSDQYNTIERDLKHIENLIAPASIKEQQHLLYLDYDLDAEVLWQKPNETVSKSLLIERKRLSPCERQLLQVHISKSHKRLYLSNTTSNFVTASHRDIAIRGENYCRVRHDKVKSNITIKSDHLRQIIGMMKYVESIELYAPSDEQLFVLLHAVDTLASRNEVRVLRIANRTINNVTDWQTIPLGTGKAMPLFRRHAIDKKKAPLLAVTAIVDHRPAVRLYEFAAETQKFLPSQVIDGDYDIIKMVTLPSGGHDQLILSCRHCHSVHIYGSSEQTNSSGQGPYQIFQILKLKVRIDQLLTFGTRDGGLYLMVLVENEQDYYHLYKYSHIQGWLHTTYGYFHNIRMALPLTGNNFEVTSKDDLLLLLCGSSSCGLVKAFVN